MAKHDDVASGQEEPPAADQPAAEPSSRAATTPTSPANRRRWLWIGVAAVVVVAAVIVAWLVVPRVMGAEPRIGADKVNRIYDPALNGLGNEGESFETTSGFPARAQDACASQFWQILGRGQTGQAIADTTTKIDEVGYVVVYDQPATAKRAYDDLVANLVGCDRAEKFAKRAESTAAPRYGVFHGRMSAGTRDEDFYVLQYGNTVTLTAAPQIKHAASDATAYRQRVDSLR